MNQKMCCNYRVIADLYCQAVREKSVHGTTLIACKRCKALRKRQMETHTFWVSSLKSHKHTNKPLHKTCSLILSWQYTFIKTCIIRLEFPRFHNKDTEKQIILEPYQPVPFPYISHPGCVPFCEAHHVHSLWKSPPAGLSSVHAARNSYPWRTLGSHGAATARQAEPRGLARFWK